MLIKYKKLLIHWLDMLILNTHILHCQVTGKRKNPEDFTIKEVREQLEASCQEGLPKHKSPGTSGSESKRQQSALALEEEEEILDLQKGGMKTAEVAQRGRCKVSLVHSIKTQKIIQEAVTADTLRAKVTSNVRDVTLVKTEKALTNWMEDMKSKNIHVDDKWLRAKAFTLYQDLKPEHKNGDSKTFLASRGWLNSFRKRLKDIQTTGKMASANMEAAKKFCEEFKKITEEGNYLPEQVFNVSETGLFWKKMPNRTCISKNKRSKAFKDHVTLLLCGNAAGHMIKPGFLYNVTSLQALKDKNENTPLYLQSNKRACVTASVFLDWLHKCCIPEVKCYLKEKDLDFKVLLLVDNAQGHLEDVRFAHDKVEVVFLPPSTTSILQPLDQGVIRRVKATYTCLVFNHVRSAMDAQSDKDVIACWKAFNFTQCMTYIKEAIRTVKPESVSACWKPLWSACVHNFKGFPVIDSDLKNIVEVGREMGGEGFDDMTEGEVEELIDCHEETLTNEELEELMESSSDEESDDDEQEEPPSWDVHKLAEFFQAARHLKDLSSKHDPSLERSTKFAHELNFVLTPYKEMFQQLRKQQ